MRQRETGLSLFSLDVDRAGIGATRSHKCGTPSGGGGGIVGWRFDRLTDQRQCGRGEKRSQSLPCFAGSYAGQAVTSSPTRESF